MRKVALLFLLILLCLPVIAQEVEREYTLRQPTRDEYLTALPAIWSLRGYLAQSVYRLEINHLLFTEVAHRYRDELPENYDLLYEAYASYYHNDYLELDNAYRWLEQWGQRLGYPDLNKRRWNTNIIMLWLNETLPDLDHVNQLVITPLDSEERQLYVLEVTARDFNGDGQNEWILREPLGGYVVIELSSHGYRSIPHHLTWYGDYDTYMNFSVDYDELALEDVNADGIPEWVLLETRVMRDRGHVWTLIILQWRDNRLVSLFNGQSETTPPNYPEIDINSLGAWSFVNLDDDSALEIYYEGTSESECTSKVWIYDWDGNRYVGTPVDTNFRPCPTATFLPTTTPTPIVRTVPYIFSEGQYAFIAGDYEVALAYFDEVLASGDYRGLCLRSHLPDDSPNRLPNYEQSRFDELCVRYWRAMTLEALDRNDEALAEYVYILETSIRDVDFDAEDLPVDDITQPYTPDWLWFELASLHIEMNPPIIFPPRYSG